MVKFKVNLGRTLSANSYNAPSGQRYTAYNGREIEIIDDLDVEYFRKKSAFTEIGQAAETPKKEPKAEEPKVEEPAEETEDLSFLKKIEGIGRKTLKDLDKIYSTRAELEKAIENGDDIPVRDDVAERLRKHLGGKK